MAGNIQRVQTLTIANGATTSETLTLDCAGLLSLQLPPLTAGTFGISGCASGSAMLPVYNEAGTQILTIAGCTGNLILGAKALADISGMAAIQVGSSAAQGADRVIVLRQKIQER
jgi:hypothetical protein